MISWAFAWYAVRSGNKIEETIFILIGFMDIVIFLIIGAICVLIFGK